MSRPVVVVGASMGGLRVAETLRKSGYLGPLVVIGDEPHAPYNRPPLSKEVLASDVSHDAVAFALADVLDDVEWKTGSAAVAADLEAQTVTLADGTTVDYEALVIATGLRSRRLDFDNKPAKGIHAIRTLDDAMALRNELVPGARVVIYGAGFIGCEAAATATKLGASVTVVGKGPVPMLRPLGLELATDIQRRQEEHGGNRGLGAAKGVCRGGAHCVDDLQERGRRPLSCGIQSAAARRDDPVPRDGGH